MNAQNELQHRLPNKALVKFLLQGAGIALILAIIFLVIILPMGGVLNGENLWQSIRQFFPLVTATVGGALGGMIYYLAAQMWHPGSWKRVLATIISILFYVVLLWLSLIAGLSATGQWD